MVGELDRRGLAGAAVLADVQRLEVVLRALQDSRPALTAVATHGGILSEDKHNNITKQFCLLLSI